MQWSSHLCRMIHFFPCFFISIYREKNRKNCILICKHKTLNDVLFCCFFLYSFLLNVSWRHIKFVVFFCCCLKFSKTTFFLTLFFCCCYITVLRFLRKCFSFFFFSGIRSYTSISLISKFRIVFLQSVDYSASKNIWIQNGKRRKKKAKNRLKLFAA